MTPDPTEDRSDAPARKRAELWTRVGVVTVTIWAVAMSLAVLYGLVLIRSTQVDGVQRSKTTLAIAQDARVAADASARATDRIEDCTTPGRKCYADGQERTAKAVGDIGKYVVYASGCAAGVDPNLSADQRVALTQACVLKRLARDKR